MARVLHLLKGAYTDLARTTMAHALAAGDEITVVLLPGSPAITLPTGVRAKRVPEELSYEGLLELVFASDQVLTW